jgi:hypothetical protein
VPDFVVQFGISGDPSTNEKWATPIQDDPVAHSNLPGTITYATAGPDTRTTQLFINYINNSRLDELGFAPFGTVVSGMETALQIFNPTPGDSGGVNQTTFKAFGNGWIRQHYPKINFLTKATIVSEPENGQSQAQVVGIGTGVAMVVIGVALVVSLRRRAARKALTVDGYINSTAVSGVLNCGNTNGDVSGTAPLTEDLLGGSPQQDTHNL